MPPLPLGEGTGSQVEECSESGWTDDARGLMLRGMKDKTHGSLEEALDLPAEEPGDVEKAWAEEIERRLKRLASGESELSDWATVRARVQREYLGR
jgi:hypothetical protein